jgi:L-iditol 2-dehydrogenase
MAVAELVACHRFEIRPYEAPPPGPGEIQVRVDAVGVCGSDLHNFAEGRIGDVESRYPMVLGHEPTGTVVRLGAGATGFAPGDRVALEAPFYCYHCEFCLTGRHNLCETVRFLSNPGEPGFFRDHVNLPPENLLAVPANLNQVEATLFEPLAIALHSFRYGAPKLGETAVVLGAGPIGLSTIGALKLAGVARIWCVEPVEHRRRMALAIGADVALDPRAGDPVEAVRADTKRRGVDMAYDCAAKDDTMNQAIAIGAAGARIVITGLPSEVRPRIDFHLMRRREQQFYTVRRSNHNSELALRLLRDNVARFAPMVTHRMKLEDAQRAFEILEAYADGVGKIVLLPN